MEMPRTSEGSMSLVNWTRWKAAIDGAGQGLAKRGLADAGNAFDEQVSAGEDADQRQADDIVLAANHAA